jgi:hypothetical protein
MSQIEHEPKDRAKAFKPAIEFGPQDPFMAAMEAFDNNERAKKGLPPIEKAMGFVDSPDFSGMLPVDVIEGDDCV